MLATESDQSASRLEQLKTIGVKLAIDDFGTGYSSLSYLKSFPVDSIKIDRSFINELHRSSTSSALVEAVVNLAQALGAYTVAEGIEYSDQAGILRKLGCDRGQGFFYCRPLSGSALTSLFREHLDEELEPLEAWRQSSEQSSGSHLRRHVRSDVREIRKFATDIDDLIADLKMPVMSSWAWLQHWAESFQNWTPLMIDVRNAETGQLMACAMLATDTRTEGSTTVVALGHSSSLYAGLPARDASSGKALAGAIVDTLNDLSEAWAIDLEQLPEHDPTLSHLLDALDHGQLLPELRVPRVVFSTAHSIDGILTRASASSSVVQRLASRTTGSR